MSASDDQRAAIRVATAMVVGRRTKLFYWLLDNYETLDVGGPIHWAAMAAELAKLEIKNRKGGPLTAASVRMTWKRVKQARASAMNRAGARASARPEILPKPTQPAVEATPVVEDEPGEPEWRVFK